MRSPQIRALVFDVFGTVVDWRGSLIREGRALGARKRLDVDWAAFADAWRAGYRPAMQKVRTGKLPWMNIDELHRLILDELLQQFGIRNLRESEKAQFNRAWHRLSPWSDSVRGLKRLKKHFVISTLSNGNVSLLTNMAKHAGLPWDCVISAELFHHYKPDPESYLGAAKLLGLKPREVMLVAAHKDDLRAAKRCALRGAFVRRAREMGPHVQADLAAERAFDYNCDDFLDLASQLGA